MEIAIIIVFLYVFIGFFTHLLTRTDKRDKPGGWSRGDDIFASVAPGIIPANASEAPVRRASVADTQLPVAVRFEPPEQGAPEDAGVLAYRNTTGADIAAAFVAMAVDGWYRIEQPSPPDAGTAPQSQDVLVRPSRPATTPALAGEANIICNPAKDRAELDPLRRGLYDAIFAAGPTTTLAAAKRAMAEPASAMRNGIEHEAIARGWYRNHRGRLNRTALGSALNAQTRGFREYLDRAEGRQIRYEEAAGVFSRYLPWAIALGVADQWAGHFAELAKEVTDPAIYDLWASDLVWLMSMDMMLGGAFTAGLGEALGGLGDSIGDLAGSFTDLGEGLFNGDSGLDGLFNDGGLFDGGDGGGGGDFGGLGDFGGFD